MPDGPKGQKRPASIIGNGVDVMHIPTGEAEEDMDRDDEGKNKAAVELGRRGGAAWAKKLTKETAFRECVASSGDALEK
jgi:hypothetical protein